MLFFFFLVKIYMYLCYLCMSKKHYHIWFDIVTTKKPLKPKIFMISYSKGKYFRQLSL